MEHPKIVYDAITFDDVLLIPAKSEFVPNDSDTHTKLTRGIELSGQAARAALVRMRPANETAIRRFDPGHPDADAQGYVSFPAINPVEEMVDLMSAVRSYQLNTAAVQATKSMIQQAFEILK